MSRAPLSETLNRLLPGEKNKRIREGILAAASYSGQRTDQLRRQIDRENRKQTGILLVGNLTFDSDAQATLSDWIWVINFAIKQPEGDIVLTVQDKDPNFTRPDYFIGMPDGTIQYRASTFDQFGNSIPPTIAEDEVILRITYRNPDGSNEQEDPSETPEIDLSDYYTKAETDPTSSIGNEIYFDRPRTYGSAVSPITSTTLTENNSNFRNVTQVIFHQAASFNPPATWQLSTGSDDYDPAKINVIYVEAFSATYKRYIIDHDE